MTRIGIESSTPKSVVRVSAVASPVQTRGRITQRSNASSFHRSVRSAPLPPSRYASACSSRRSCAARRIEARVGKFSMRRDYQVLERAGSLGHL
jgi:hypothetical protein